MGAGYVAGSVGVVKDAAPEGRGRGGVEKGAEETARGGGSHLSEVLGRCWGATIGLSPSTALLRDYHWLDGMVEGWGCVGLRKYN